MRVVARVTAALAVLAPALGALVASQIHFPSIPGWWQGLVIQLFLLLAPLDMVVNRRAPAWIGLRRQGLRASLVIGGLLAALYVVGLVVAAGLGITVSHFDAARRELGLLPVLLLYIPFWGVLEGVWVNHLVRTLTAALGARIPTWSAILAAGVWFGLVHVLVVLILEGGGPSSTANALIGVFAVLAGWMLRRTGNGWGFVLFWTVSNF